MEPTEESSASGRKAWSMMPNAAKIRNKRYLLGFIGKVIGNHGKNTVNDTIIAKAFL